MSPFQTLLIVLSINTLNNIGYITVVGSLLFKKKINNVMFEDLRNADNSDYDSKHY